MEPYLPERDLLTAITLDKADWILRGLIFLTPNEYQQEPRAALLASFGSLVIEHFRSIVELCRDGQSIGSALALFRPLLDASLRGQWLYLCASDDQRLAFMKNDFRFIGRDFTFKALAEDVDEASPHKEFFVNFSTYYSQLCDWTHTGHDAVSMRLTSDGIQPAYSSDRVRLLLETAARVTALHFSFVSAVTGQPETAERLASLLLAFGT